MSERENILGRIRDALATTAPLPGTHEHTGSAATLHTPRAAAALAREWLPAAGSGFADWLDLFSKNAAELKAALHVCQDQAGAAAHLREIAAAEAWKKVACHGVGIASELAAQTRLPTLRTDDGYQASDLEQCDAGISECDALVAQTGSVLVTSRSAGGRALSVLPPHHIVLARREQLLPDLPAAYDLLHRKCDGHWPSMISFITGPSRTGDIERILVLGAHGPKKLTILLW